MPPKIGKKGKGGPQNASGTKGKATKAVPMDASDSEEESSDLGSSEEDEAPPVVKAAVKKAQAPVKKQEPSDDDSEDDSEESDEGKTPVSVVKAAKNNVAESDKDDSEEEEEEEKPVAGQKRKLPQLNVQPPKKAPKGNNKQKPEKDSEDEEDSEEEEESEESEASDDEPVVDQKKQKQFQQAQKNKANVNGKKSQKAAAAEESDEDDEDSDEESGEEESDEEEEEVEEKTNGKKKNKESVKASNDVPDDVVTIFCGNLKDDCGPKDLKKLFKKKGIEVIDARKPVGKRFGYVDLANASDLQTALALDQTSFQDQVIKVEQAKKRPDMTGASKTPNAAKDKSQKDDKDCTLFVKNLAESVTEKTVREFFPDAVELRMPKTPDGSHKGFAYIQFKDASVVEKMMNKHQGAELEGQALYLDYVGQKSSFKSPVANKSSGEPGKSKVLFVKNLSYSVTDEKLMDTFEGAVSARIPTFPDTGKPKGFAFIDFETAEAAQEAYDKCQGQDLEGREMKVDFALDKGDRGRSPGGGNFGGRGRGGGGGRGNFRGGRGGRGGGGNWDRGGRGGRGGGRGGGDRGFGDKRRSFDNSGSAKNKKVKLDSDSD
ncbi:hypothetical protein ACJMK2_034773 [Sinanodonta woodiana]|uniref:RRM domain-containing protein n=1 Tax=Sinanodonta woodiana TaxID=1069815 RepID=A0ABD3WT97_SINWO